ncbi:MAG: hypothetical protein WC205_02510 [Opitutaceae bacterium]|jgi:hypothetical protein
MTFAELTALTDPAGLSLPLQALWHELKGNWDLAHDLCQRAKSRDGDWVHAYLHRKEGDLGNAGYWYARAGRSMPEETITHAAEWAAIVDALS